jgi:predicted metalloprotease with PDZ domain
MGMLTYRGLRAVLTAGVGALALLSGACGGPSKVQETHAGADVADKMSIVLMPLRGQSGKVEVINVSMVMPSPDIQAGEVLLSMAVVRVMMPSALSDVASLVAEDEAGPLELTIEEDAPDPSMFRQDRRWVASRATAGNVTVTYTLRPRVITASTSAGPLIDTRTELSGFYGSGNTMLALPPWGWPQDVDLSWDLSGLPEGARAASSLGEGGVTAHIDKQGLSNSFFMAGPLNSQPENGEGEFVVYWITPPAFDLQGAAEWTQAGYEYFSDFFDQHGTAFRIFMRTTERFQGGGGGGFNSFIFGTVEGEDRDPKEVRSLLAHETLHHFVGGYGEGGGAGGQQWYSEGATSYYTIVLPYRAGLTRTEDFISDFNAHALNYYTNPQSGLSNEEVTALFFSDNNAQLVPYNRGPLYMALLDYQMRVASKGGKRLDDVIFKFIDGRDEAGDSIDYWRELLVESLGTDGGDAFDAMMNGAPLNLPADMFGACFEGQETVLREFKSGLRTYGDETGQTRISRVFPGTPGEAAGFQKDDIVLNPEILASAAGSEPGSEIALEIRRGERSLTVVYAPWTAPASGLQWVRSDVPETECRL